MNGGIRIKSNIHQTMWSCQAIFLFLKKKEIHNKVHVTSNVWTHHIQMDVIKANQGTIKKNGSLYESVDNNVKEYGFVQIVFSFGKRLKSQ